MTPFFAIALTATGAAIAVATVLGDYYVTLLSYVGLYSIVTLGLIVLTGHAGLMSFGQAAFVGLSAYTTAVLTTEFGWSPWLSLIACIAMILISAYLIGWITMRLSSFYLSLGTIAWGVSLSFAFGNIQTLGGFNGIAEIPPLRFFGVSLIDPRYFAYLIIIVLALCMWSAANLMESRSGRAIRVLRRRMLAESFGVDTFQLKVRAFLFAAVLAALCGWLMAHYLRFVNPNPFGINHGIEYLFMAVIGGVSQIWGAVVGAALVTTLKSVLQDVLPKMFGRSGQFELIAFGVVIIGLLQYAPGGIVQAVKNLTQLRSRRLPPKPVPLAPRRARPAAGETILEVSNLTKAFGGLVAVRNVSFSARSAEILGVIGPNGAGKSTLFNVISGVERPSAGTVSFCGKRLDLLPHKEIVTCGVARTFQHVQLAPEMVVIDNVALGAYSRERSGLIQAICRLERAEYRRTLYEAAKQVGRLGLEKQMFSHANSLPLGQQRLVEIARALAADPILLMLDEPAAGLRHREKEQLAQLLRGLRDEGLTILLVEHDMEFLMNLVDRVVVMNFGEKIADGRADDVQKNQAVIDAYLGVELD